VSDIEQLMSDVRRVEEIIQRELAALYQEYANLVIKDISLESMEYLGDMRPTIYQVNIDVGLVKGV